MILETVTVKADNAKGRKIINKSDFVDGVHELFVDNSEAKDRIKQTTTTRVKPK